VSHKGKGEKIREFTVKSSQFTVKWPGSRGTGKLESRKMKWERGKQTEGWNRRSVEKTSGHMNVI